MMKMGENIFEIVEHDVKWREKTTSLKSERVVRPLKSVKKQKTYKSFWSVE